MKENTLIVIQTFTIMILFIVTTLLYLFFLTLLRLVIYEGEKEKFKIKIPWNVECIIYIKTKEDREKLI